MSSKDKKTTPVENPLSESSNGQQALPAPCSRSTPDSCRETLRINHEEQAFHHHLTVGLQEKLRKSLLLATHIKYLSKAQVKFTKS